MAASIARARLKLQLDVSFGDPVTPGPQAIGYPQHLSDDTFPLLGYPIATVIAEKLSTAVALGDFNTRDRDWADLYQLISRHLLDRAELAAALQATAGHRGISLRPLSAVVGDLAVTRQAPYTAWLRRQGSAAADHPELFADVVAEVIAFADPLLDGTPTGHTWDPAKRTWS